MTCKGLKCALLLITCCVLFAGCRGTNSFFDRFRNNTNNAGAAPPLSPMDGGIESSVLPEPIRGQNAQESADLKRIYFSYDSAALLDPARQQLDANAAWLRANPQVQIQIEGHCDVRGTSDYNYSLGQRRADTARSYLVQQGVSADRLHTISYGSERPDDPSDEEMAWARNRRAQFLVYGQ
ncbi:MAG: peptidoglycan-associated lipoprotein Pal [Candidatus Sumerlaeaceae bacterium]